MSGKPGFLPSIRIKIPFTSWVITLAVPAWISRI